MGGDQGSRPIVFACAEFAKKNPSVNLMLFGIEQEIKQYLPQAISNIQINDAESVVSMDEKPSLALRRKSNSSMALAVNKVATGEAQACISAGNTGALMAFGLQLLNTLENIDRPAICKAMPSKNGRSYILDLGANVECTPEQLVQFAYLGVAMAEAAGCNKPIVGVLNMGVEAFKGKTLQQQALALLQQGSLNVKGFVEGDGIYNGDVDVLVCDGFTGNAVLKASEGAAALMRESLVDALNKMSLSEKNAMELKLWAKQYDPQLFNGAVFLGLNGIVVKSHGDTNEVGFDAALKVAVEQVAGDYISSVSKALAAL